MNKKKPSVLNLFPLIGMADNKTVYQTSKFNNEKPLNNCS